MGRSCYKKMKLSQKRFLMGNFMIQDQLENREKMEGCHLEGNITDPRNTRMEDRARTQR
jgi:hypothetical protein